MIAGLASILGFLLWFAHYVRNLAVRIDEIGYMVATLLDFFEVPGCTSEDCQIETMADLQQFVVPHTNISRTPVMESSGWRQWDKEEE
tara:strand:+ start:2752 stop:3015 length:264 start_codon:yes stop_codon:yes gene_type:complete